jgi:arylsulfatase A-like enzyme
MKMRLLIPMLTTAFLVIGCATDNAELQRPNIIFFMSDDHTSQAVSAYGGMLADVCPTPNIDRLADEGMLFTNCFVTNSICTPSRAAIFTGNYAHINGVYKFTALDQRQPTLPKEMKKAGYETAFYGKYHLHSNPVAIDHFAVLPGQGRYHNPRFIVKGDENPNGWLETGKKTKFEGHSSDVIADLTLDYLQNKRAEDKPFMLFCHFKAPHDTWEYAKRYEEFLADVEIPEPDNLFDDYEGRSDALKNTLQYIGSEWGDHTNFEEETAHLEGEAKRKMQYQLYMKKYLRCVKGVDDNMGRILDYLDETGLAENTLIMYTGDQGFYLGEHGLYDKRFMYEEGLRMPFLVRWPGKVEKGSVSDGMILNVDFAATIMEAAGIKEMPEMQGRSFYPLLEGSIPEDWRNSMYYRYYYSHFETEPHYGVRTYDYKLICFNRIDQWELYDLKSDPMEMNNLYDHPDYQDKVAELKTQLTRLQTELGDDPDDIGDHPNIGELDEEELERYWEESDD